MMGRILSRNTSVFTFKELHFFGNIFSSDDKKILKETESEELLSKLLCIQEHGIFNFKDYKKFNKISKRILKRRDYTSIEIFKFFLNYTKKMNNAIISCEQTPRNIFYLEEILNNFSNTKIINMVRDPRDVLLSQKNKWKRRYYGASFIPLKEAIRSYFNYHPITISKIWNSCMFHANKFKNDKRVKTIYFERLLLYPKETMIELCDFLDISFSEDMLIVPNIGSSTVKDHEKKDQIDRRKIGNWKLGGLNNSEIYINQRMCKKYMNKHDYELEKIRISFFYLLPIIIIFPIKIMISFILNLNRFKSLKDLINKRILTR